MSGLCPPVSFELDFLFKTERKQVSTVHQNAKFLHRDTILMFRQSPAYSSNSAAISLQRLQARKMKSLFLFERRIIFIG